MVVAPSTAMTAIAEGPADSPELLDAPEVSHSMRETLESTSLAVSVTAVSVATQPSGASLETVGGVVSTT